MVKIKNCYYKDCWYNDNFENICTADELTLDFTGICEKLMHCDEFICSNCEKYDICDKDKKNEFLKE